MNRTCIFCGASPTTNAHIFRKAWLDQVFPGTGKFAHRHLRRDQPGFDKSWSRDEADIKVACACASCNSGWMDRLDRSAESLFLDRAVRGYPAQLARMADKETLARWCLLVAALSDQTQRTPILETATHRAVCDGKIPTGVRVWLFDTQPPPWEIAVFIENRSWKIERASGETGDAYFVTFVVGHLVVQAFVPTERTPRGIHLDREPHRPLFCELWSPPLTPLNWPPPQSIAWTRLGELADAFEGPFPDSA